MSEELKTKNALMQLYYLEELSPKEISEVEDGKIPAIKTPCTLQNIRHHLSKHGLQKVAREWTVADEVSMVQYLKDLSTGDSFRKDCSNVALICQRKLSEVMTKCQSAWEELHGKVQDMSELIDIEKATPLSVVEEVDSPRSELVAGFRALAGKDVVLRVSPVVDEKTGQYKYEDLYLPEYKTPGAVALDLCSAMYAQVRPGNTTTIGTGIVVSIPEGFVGMVLPRSGLAAKHCITVLNSPGIIDSDYCGPSDEVKVILINHGTGSSAKTFEVKPGDRIAQLMLVRVANVTVEETDEYDRDDSRGGLGSTGI